MQIGTLLVCVLPCLLNSHDTYLKWQVALNFKSHTFAIWYAGLRSVAPLATILNLLCCVFTTGQRHCLHKGLHHLSTSSETDRRLCPCRATLRGGGGGLLLVKLWLLGSWQPAQPVSGIGLVSTVYLNYDLSNRAALPMELRPGCVTLSRGWHLINVARVIDCHNSVVCTLLAVESTATTNSNSHVTPPFNPAPRPVFFSLLKQHLFPWRLVLVLLVTQLFFKKGLSVLQNLCQISFLSCGPKFMFEHKSKDYKITKVLKTSQ